MRPAAAIIAIGCAFVTSCAYRSIGVPPDDFDLRTDGTPQALHDRIEQYRVTCDGTYVARPGAPPETIAYSSPRLFAPDHPTEVKSLMLGDEAFDYLTSSEATDEKLHTGAVGFARFAYNTLDMALLSGLPLLGAAAGFGVSTYDAVTAYSQQGSQSSPSLTDTFFSVGAATAGGALAGFVAAVPFILVNQMFLVPALTRVAATDYKAAARAYNKDLEKRVKEQAGKGLPAEAEPGAEASVDITDPSTLETLPVGTSEPPTDRPAPADGTERATPEESA